MLEGYFMWIWQPTTVDIGELEQPGNHLTWKLIDVVGIFSFSSVGFLSESYGKNLVHRKGERGKVHSFQMPDNAGLFPLFSSLHEKHHTASELEYIYKSPRSWPKLGEAALEPEQEVCQPGGAVQYPK